MALNFLNWHTHGGGPAHLLVNPARRHCASISVLNATISTLALSSMIFGNYTGAAYGLEISQYWIGLILANGYSSIYFARLAKRRVESDSEWSRILITMFLINILQYGLIVWGVWLCYRMIYSKVFIGTKMYYYFGFGKWVHNTILGISALNCYCIIYTTYVSLVKILVSLVFQTSKKTL